MTEEVGNTTMPESPEAAFIRAATWHGSLEQAEALLASHPELASSSIHTAAILGNAKSVKQFLEADAAHASVIADPYGADALVYLCLSKYLRLHKEKEDDFVQAATALLKAGADPNAGFWTKGQHPEFETALYGAAGVAHNAKLTRLLLDHGADPNDGEAIYHSPETCDNEAMQLLVETGRVTPENLIMMLIRKHDWHDYHGVKYLLEHGADPNGERSRGWYPIHHALARDNHIAIISLLFDHDVDPYVINDGLTAIARAAHEGRGDILAMVVQRGIPIRLQGVDRLIAACAMDDTLLVRTIIKEEPQVVDEMMSMANYLLAKFTGTGNLPGVRQLLDIGVDVNTPFAEGDGYFGIPKNTLPIHVAAWRIRPEIVQLLIERGSLIDLPDANGNTPLALAVRACVDSWWTERRSPAAVSLLLEAGASVKNIPFPSGYAAVDELLIKYQS